MDLIFPVERLKTTSLSLHVSQWSYSDSALLSVYGDDEETTTSASTSTEAETEGGFGLLPEFGGAASVPRLDLRGGLYLNRQLNPTLGVGLIRAEGLALGRYSGQESEDSCSLLVVPIEGTLFYRFDYGWDQLLIPFIGVGVDGWVWREETPSTVISGVKWGAHGTLGALFRLNFMETSGRWSGSGQGWPSDVGISVEGSYGWVDSFGGEGLDFSGRTLGAGLNFSF